MRSAAHARTAHRPAGPVPTLRPRRSQADGAPADPTGADQPAVCELYTRVARAREGLLTRTGRPFAADHLAQGGRRDVAGVRRARRLSATPAGRGVAATGRRPSSTYPTCWRSPPMRRVSCSPCWPGGAASRRQCGCGRSTSTRSRRCCPGRRPRRSTCGRGCTARSTSRVRWRVAGWPLSRRGRVTLPSARSRRGLERRSLAVRRRRRARRARRAPERIPSCGCTSPDSRCSTAGSRPRPCSPRPGLLHGPDDVDQRPGADPSQVGRAAARLLLTGHF